LLQKKYCFVEESLGLTLTDLNNKLAINI